MGTVAVIDADPRERTAVAAALRSAGHEVLQWARPALALHSPTLAARPPDLLIVGLGLTDEGGLDLLVRLRDRHARPFPTLVLSADPADATRAGATDHLQRPFDAARLATTVERLVRA